MDKKDLRILNEVGCYSIPCLKQDMIDDLTAKKIEEDEDESEDEE